MFAALARDFVVRFLLGLVPAVPWAVWQYHHLYPTSSDIYYLGPSAIPWLACTAALCYAGVGLTVQILTWKPRS